MCMYNKRQMITMVRIEMFRQQTGRWVEGAEKAAVVEIVGISPARFCHIHFSSSSLSSLSSSLSSSPSSSSPSLSSSSFHHHHHHHHHYHLKACRLVVCSAVVSVAWDAGPGLLGRTLLFSQIYPKAK